MLIRDQDLLSLRMIAADDSAHTVTDVLLRPDGLRAAYVVADIGAWLADHRVRVEIDRFEAPDVSARTWRAAIGASELDATPEAGRGALTLVRAGAGSTDADGALLSIVALSNGVGVDAEDGEAGKLMGLIFDSGDWAARHIVIETGGRGAREHQRVVPVELIDDADWTGGALRLKATRAQVRDSPDLHEIDGLEGKWYNKVLAYYGMQS